MNVFVKEKIRRKNKSYCCKKKIDEERCVGWERERRKWFKRTRFSQENDSSLYYIGKEKEVKSEVCWTMKWVVLLKRVLSNENVYFCGIVCNKGSVFVWLFLCSPFSMKEGENSSFINETKHIWIIL